MWFFTVSEENILESNEINLFNIESNKKNELAKIVETKMPSVRYTKQSKIPIPKLHKNYKKGIKNLCQVWIECYKKKNFNQSLFFVKILFKNKF